MAKPSKFETPFFQFWAAFVGCDKQFRDAFRFTAQQIDVIKRLAEAYPEDMDFVTTAAGDLKNEMSKLTAHQMQLTLSLCLQDLRNLWPKVDLEAW